MKRKTLAFVSAFLLCASMIAIGQSKSPKIIPPDKMTLPPSKISTISGVVTWDGLANTRCNSLLCGPDCIAPEHFLQVTKTGGYSTKKVKSIKVRVYEYVENPPPPPPPAPGEISFNNPPNHEGKEVKATIVWGSSGKYFQNYTIKLNDPNKYTKVIVVVTHDGYFDPKCKCSWCTPVLNGYHEVVGHVLMEKTPIKDEFTCTCQPS